jgi:hypothetical protein
LTVNNVDSLNGFGSGGSDVFLTTTVDITKSPAPKWLEGVVPDSSGKTGSAISSAIIVNDHGGGAVDAFYMYFYAYNQGNKVLGQELGDHIGDWEHNMIRFKDGVPQHVWYSQHSGGQAFTYGATEKVGKRPVSYSAKGSHANYAISGNTTIPSPASTSQTDSSSIVPLKAYPGTLHSRLTTTTSKRMVALRGSIIVRSRL